MKSVAFLKHLAQLLFVFGHPLVELLFGNVNVLNLDVKILASRKRIFLILDFFECDYFRDVILLFLLFECIDDFLYLKVSVLSSGGFAIRRL